jgi:hypothetical protein
MPFDVRLVDQGIDWAAWITAGSAVATMVIVGITAWYAKGSLNDAKRTRHAQLVTDLSRRWDEPVVIESSSLSAKHGSTGIVELIDNLYGPQPERPGWRYRRRRGQKLSLYSRIFLWPNLLETLGCLHAEKAISTDVVYSMWGAEIVAAWETFRRPIARLREHEQDRGIYRHLEKLSDVMKPLHDNEKQGSARPSSSR